LGGWVRVGVQWPAVVLVQLPRHLGLVELGAGLAMRPRAGQPSW
jgi:hypothetical protein